MKSTLNQVPKIFALNLTSLAVARIVLGILICFFSIDMLFNAKAFLSNEGISQSTTVQKFFGPMAWSVYHLSSELFFVYCVLICQILLSLGLTLGYKTRFCNVLLWILWCSMNSRNPLIFSSEVHVFKMILFWMIFLPVGKTISLDERRLSNAANTKTSAVASMGTVAFIFQVMIIYFSAGVFKMDAAWISDGHALELALKSNFGNGLAPYVLKYFSLILPTLTYVIFWAEILSPLLILLSLRWLKLRFFVIGFFAIFHIGCALFLKLYMFPWVCLVFWIALLPSEFWKSLKKQNLSASSYQAKFPSFLSAALFVLICINLYELDYNLNKYYSLQLNSFDSKIYMPLRQVLQIDQRWKLFAPTPPQRQYYLDALVQTSSGKNWSVLHKKYENEYSFQQFPIDYRGNFWEKYFIQIMTRPKNKPFLTDLSDFFCRQAAQDLPLQERFSLEKISIFSYAEILKQDDSISSIGDKNKHKTTFIRRLIADKSCPKKQEL